MLNLNKVSTLPEGIELLSDEMLDYVTGGAWSDARDGMNGGSAAADRDREQACRGDVAKGALKGAVAGAAKGKTPVDRAVRAAVGAAVGGMKGYDKSSNCGPRR